MPYNAEWEQKQALIDRILRSPEMRGWPTLSKLLLLLYKREETPEENAEPLSAKLLAEALRIRGASKLEATRMRVGALRGAVADYFNSDAGRAEEPWACEVPDGGPLGYRLVFRERGRVRSATHAFWKPHIVAPLPTVICYTEPLFFLKGLQAIRLFDVNTSKYGGAGRKQAIEELERKHPEMNATGFEPAHAYLLIGEVGAREALTRWFGRRNIQIPSEPSRRQDLNDISPILLGSPSVNHIMEEILEGPTGSGLALLPPANAHGPIRIRDITAGDKNALDKQGILQNPERFRPEGQDGLLFDKPFTEVYGIVTRIPHPYSDGVVTMISAETTRVVEQMARLLADGEALKPVREQAGYGEREPFPPSFQWLFAVRTIGNPMDSQGAAPARYLLGRRFDAKA